MRRASLVFSVLTTSAACSLVVGDGDLRYDGATGAGPTTGGGGTSSTGGMSSNGGAGGSSSSNGGTGAGGAEGGAAGCTGPQECVAPADPCREATCANGNCGDVAKPLGAECNVTDKCDASGACVECLSPDDCAAGSACPAGFCVPVGCMNDDIDAGETDVDCGGSNCPPCANALMCESDTDCMSGFCNNLVCAPCVNSGTDCPSSQYCDAGVCKPRLLDGTGCSSADECISGNCVTEQGTSLCCESDCAGSCQACLTPTPGMCIYAAANTDPKDACGNYVCNGSMHVCWTSCTQQIQCDQGSYCDLSVMTPHPCETKKLNDEACTQSYECESGYCFMNLCTDP